MSRKEQPACPEKSKIKTTFFCIPGTPVRNLGVHNTGS